MLPTSIPSYPSHLQIKEYRGLPFRAKARGIFNATGLNEGIVFVSSRRC